MNRINRREFVGTSLGAVTAATLASTEALAQDIGPADKRPKKACMYGMLPGKLSPVDRLKLAKDVGFEGIESAPMGERESEDLRKAAETAGIRIHSVIFGGWDAPLSSNNPEVAARGVKNAEAALLSAHLMGADDILLVPALVDAHTRYADAYKNSQENVKKLIPTAEKLKVLILIEEVWNNFLLSPLEYCAYVDSFHSKWVQSYFDIGNVVAFAWPEDWIRTLGKRIKKMHLKDYKGGPGLFGSRGGNFVNIREGSINWPEVRKAMADINYTGYITTELGGGDEAYLRDLVSRFDKILAGV